MQDKRPDERRLPLAPGMVLTEKKNGLGLTTDALLLAAFCRGKKGERAVEFGCGSGAVSLLLARRNAAENGYADTVLPLLADVRDLDAARLGGAADAVVTNPPYFDPAGSRPSPSPERQAARQADAGDIFDFTAAAARCLKKSGRFFAVWRPDRIAALFAALRGAGLEPKRMGLVAAHKKAAPSLVLIEAVRGGGEGLTILPTLFLCESAGPNAPMTAEAAALYQTGAWPF